MLSITQLLEFARWSGYFTLLCAALMVLGLIFKWGIRFRLVGVASFMAVLTIGLFTLSLGIHQRTEIPGAVKFSRVFDVGAARIVIAVPPQITPTQLDATLRQAAADLYSPGRLSEDTGALTIVARTIIHPEPGVSKPVYLGQIKRSPASRADDQSTVEIDQTQFTQLSKASV